MKLIIDIPDEDYKFIKLLHEGLTDYQTTLKLYRVVKNGTPLPKGHGRLGDLDALEEEVSSWGMNDYEPLDFIDEIDRANTIIEADKE